MSQIKKEKKIVCCFMVLSNEICKKENEKQRKYSSIKPIKLSIFKDLN